MIMMMEEAGTPQEFLNKVIEVSPFIKSTAVFTQSDTCLCLTHWPLLLFLLGLKRKMGLEWKEEDVGEWRTSATLLL